MAIAVEARATQQKVSWSFIFHPARTKGTSAIKFVIESMVTEIRKVDSDLGKKFHPIFITVTAKITLLGADKFVNISFEVSAEVEYLISSSKVFQ